MLAAVDWQVDFGSTLTFRVAGSNHPHRGAPFRMTNTGDLVVNGVVNYEEGEGIAPEACPCASDFRCWHWMLVQDGGERV